jgi:hypothetical protein
LRFAGSFWLTSRSLAHVDFGTAELKGDFVHLRPLTEMPGRCSTSGVSTGFENSTESSR